MRIAQIRGVTLRRLWWLPIVGFLAPGVFLFWPGQRAPKPLDFPDEARTRPPLLLIDSERDAALRRARVWLERQDRSTTSLTTTPDPSGTLAATVIECEYRMERPHGTTTKFTCILPSGEPIKVKYGFTREKAAEIAASRLLTRLGFLADDMFRVQTVRCYGCPRRPFELSWAADRLHVELTDVASPDRYVDFEDVAVERRFPARSIETERAEGWSWYELDTVDPHDGASLAHRDALRLVAMLLAHWDNKAENQRLLCLDEDDDGVRCRRPWAMIHDLGSTFGPHKVDLDAWQATPVWSDPRTCTISMRQLPYGGGTFPDTQISERGRQLLASELDTISWEETRAWFGAAGFDVPEKWAAAFREKVREIRAAGPCSQ